MTKYTESDYNEVKKLRSENVTVTNIRKITGISETNIRKILDPALRKKMNKDHKKYWKDNADELNDRRKKRRRMYTLVINQARRSAYKKKKDVLNKKRRQAYKIKHGK